MKEEAVYLTVETKQKEREYRQGSEKRIAHKESV